MPLFENMKKPNSETTPPLKEKPSGLINTLGQLLPLAPFLFEQVTGQKVPPLTGTIAEMHLALTSIQTALQMVVRNQQELAQRLVNLETNASSQFTNLTQQVQGLKSIRLTHDRERKQIDYNLENPE